LTRARTAVVPETAYLSALCAELRRKITLASVKTNFSKRGRAVYAQTGAPSETTTKIIYPQKKGDGRTQLKKRIPDNGDVPTK
jgi:hypothetical protein